MAEVSLLDFPSPPTHIPNPPPSLPPALPLPPVPGPSPISDNFLRRSIASYRDSIAAVPLSDLDDDDPVPPRKSHHFNESISDIQLPLSDPDDEDDHTATFADPIDPMTLHLQIRAFRSRSASHKQFLRARSVSPSRARSLSKSPVPPIPPSPRPPSPDVPALLSTTPRPRRYRSALLSDVSHADHPLPRRVSAGDIAIECARTRPFNLDHAIAFPSMLSNGAEIEAKLGRQLDGADSDSDSSIDLHTPLPRLMVRDGLLSPQSKLLPQPGNPFSPQVRSSVYSIVSTTSNMTKSGIMKDTRDTPMRRHRHRDGRLLRGGIGLTTGLGWSDSEDEDAPSPLTRRLSSLSLLRRSSVLSVRSTPVYSLSRSFSGSSVIEESEGRDNYDGPVRQRSNTLTSNSRQATKSPHPPTSWQRRTHTSSFSKDSLQLSIPEQPEHGNQQSISEYDSANTPSSASSLSIPTPSTPADDLPTRGPTGIMDKNKRLPPLPTALRKPSSNTSLESSLVSRTRIRTISSTSSVRSMSNSPPSIPLPPVPALNCSPTPRPLKLPEAYRRQSQSYPQTPFRGGGLDRPAVPVPGVSYLNSSLRPLGTSTSNPALSVSTMPRSLPRPVSRLPCKSPTAPTSPTGDVISFPLSTLTSAASVNKQKPRPRIGSGMVYRTSSYASIDGITAGASKRRAPKSLTLASNGHPPSAPRSASTSLPITRSSTLRTPSGMHRTIVS